GPASTLAVQVAVSGQRNYLDVVLAVAEPASAEEGFRANDPTIGRFDEVPRIDVIRPCACLESPSLLVVGAIVANLDQIALGVAAIPDERVELVGSSRSGRCEAKNYQQAAVSHTRRPSMTDGK